MSFSERIIANQRQLTTLKNDGWDIKTSTKIIYKQGRAFRSLTASKDISCLKGFFRVSSYVLGTLACLPFTILTCGPKDLPTCSVDCCAHDYCKQIDCFERYFVQPFSGCIDKQKLYLYDEEESQKVYQKDYEALGFNPDDNESLKSFFIANKRNAYEHCKHHFMILEAPHSHAQVYLFAPSANYSNIETGVVYNGKTYESVSTKAAIKIMMKECENYTPGQSTSSGSLYKARTFTPPQETRNLTNEELLQAAMSYVSNQPLPEGITITESTSSSRAKETDPLIRRNQDK